MLDSSSPETARRAPALPTLLTIDDVAYVLRTSRSTAYSAWRHSGDGAGLIGKSLQRRG